MSSAAAKRARRADENLNEDTERRIADFFDHRELGRVRRTERRARNRKYSAALTKIKVPYDFNLSQNFWDQYNLDTVTEIDARLSKIQNADVEYVARMCPNLTTLRLNDCDITDESLFALSQNCPQLLSLNVAYCSAITNAGVVALSQGCRQLMYLNLSDCEKITDNGVIALAQGCPQLTSLYLQCCENITDAGVIALAQGCPQLLSFELTTSKHITDASIIAIAQACPKLTNINLAYCRNITTRSVIALAYECSELSVLDIKCCDMNITYNDIHYRAHESTNLNASWKIAREVFSRNLQQMLYVYYYLSKVGNSFTIRPGQFPGDGARVSGIGGTYAGGGASGGAASQLVSTTTAFGPLRF